MAPPVRRRLGSRIEAQLTENSYSWQTFCQELPYTLWNTCPLCLCGLMPVFVVCISAMCRLDYATQVTDIGAELINEMGLSYTVYYTAGCWPQSTGPLSLIHRRARCNQADFEIAASEFDAVRGTLLREKNVTKLHAKRLTAVKVTPDWRFVTFIGSLSEDIGNLYAVDAQDKDAPEAIPLLTQTQLTSLDAACELHTDSVRAVLQEAKPEQHFLKQQARLSGFKHLQVIIPGIEAVEFGGSLQGLPVQPFGTSLVYRATFSFTCRQEMSMLEAEPIQFSKLAVVDFQFKNLTGGHRQRAFAASQLRILSSDPLAPRGANQGAVVMAKRYLSHCCPRFVPSKQGAELLFVAEDVAPVSGAGRWAPVVALPTRVLAQMQLLEQTVTGRKLEEVWSDVESNLSTDQLAQAMERHEAEVLSRGAQEINAEAQMLSVGEHEMPFAPVRGCPEFVPSLYSSTQSLQEAVRSDLFESEEQRLREQRLRDQTRDSFVCMTDPSSSSVLGIDAQVLAGSLAPSPMGEVSFRQLLYNVKSLNQNLVLGGCKPIRAAGRQGHMRMEAALESVMKTLRISDDRTKYTTWLACLTSDQKVAIVESEDTKNWINMSMPYPFWTANHPFVWCAEEHQESCFEVWSNPNPNE